MDWLARGRGTPFTDPVDQIGQMSLWVSLPLTCALGPLVEELCFRRAVLERLRPYGDGFALCASAILFALFHGNLFQSLYTLAIGFLLGGVTLYTGQLRWAVGFHAAFNLISVGLSPLASALGTPGEMTFSLFVIFHGLDPPLAGGPGRKPVQGGQVHGLGRRRDLGALCGESRHDRVSPGHRGHDLAQSELKRAPFLVERGPFPSGAAL